MLKTLVAAAALVVLIGCGGGDVPPDEPANTPPPLPDTLARADQIVADLKKREAVARAAEESLEEASKPGVPVINEFPARRYQPPAYTTYQDYNAPRQSGASEAEWRNQAKQLESRYTFLLQAANDAMRRMEEARAKMINRNAATFVAAERAYVAAEYDYRSNMAQAEQARASVDQFRENARRQGIPPGWTRP